jgi:hypothetical protein
MSISKERWIATGDPRSGFEVYDDEGNEQYCSLCGEGLKSLESDFCKDCGDEPCACGHPRDCHANENVQPNCCECGCSGFTKESVQDLLAWKLRCEELEVIAAAFYLGHDDAKRQFDMYRSVYLTKCDFCEHFHEMNQTCGHCGRER